MERDLLLLHYRHQLAAELGHRCDESMFERTWQLSWLKAVAQLAFCLVDPLVGSADRGEVERVRGVPCGHGTCKANLRRARQLRS